jgi:O-methyltransferase involved in polyketide biosynthesis
VEALSLDLLAHAVGGFSALTEEEQTSTLRNIENTLPREFSIVLGLVRDVYYEDERTPERPKSFDNDDEIFGKVVVEEEPEQVSKKRR